MIRHAMCAKQRKAPKSKNDQSIAGSIPSRGNGLGFPSAIQKKNETGLPDELKTGVENLSGTSLDDVKVHFNSSKPGQLHAHAYAQGTDIHVAPGQQQHLPHEAWHVAQQKQGRVKADTKVQGVDVNTDQALETEADVMGKKALDAPAVQRKELSDNHPANIVQREENGEEEMEAEDELSEVLGEFRSMLAKAAEQNPDAPELETISEYITELEEVAAGSDEEMKSAVAAGLQEELEENTESGSPEELSGTEESTSTTSENGIVQGIWGVDKLWALLTYNLYATSSVAVLLFILERAVAYKKKKRLPPRIDNNLFNNSRQAYWHVVDRKISEFCRVNNIIDGDKTLIRNASVAALNAAPSSANFIGVRLPMQLNGLAYTGPTTAAVMGGAGANFINSLDNDITGIAARTINTAVVPNGAKAGFIAALKTIPFVQKLYSGKVRENQGKSDKAWGRVKGKSAWKNGGSVTSNIQQVDDGNRLTRDNRRMTNGDFAKDALSAERFIKQAVEPAVLAQVPRPTIQVHLRNCQARTRPWGFRAFHNGTEVHVAQDHPVHTIVHEMGHHVEDHVPMMQWSDIQLLLQTRNTDPNAGYIYPHSYSEQRFGGEYPATGKYTSKYYEGGATEVTSMSMEYLSNPDRYRTLIETDPQQAAIMLRMLRPTEYAAAAALRAYDIYLPA